MVIVFPINLYTGIRCTSYSFRSIISRLIWYLFAFYIRAKNSDAPLIIFHNLRNLNISLKDVATIVCFLKCSTVHVKILLLSESTLNVFVEKRGSRYFWVWFKNGSIQSVFCLLLLIKKNKKQTELNAAHACLAGNVEKQLAWSKQLGCGSRYVCFFSQYIYL